MLPAYPPDLSARARRQLEDLGVRVLTRAMVTGVDGSGVWLGPERIAALHVLVDDCIACLDDGSSELGGE